MPLAQLIERLLDKRRIPAEHLSAAGGVSPREDWLERTVPLATVARLSVLKDASGLVLALYPMSHRLNLQTLRDILHRNLGFCDTDNLSDELSMLLEEDADPLNRANGIDVIIDETLSNQDTVHFESVRPCSLLKIAGDDLQQLAEDALIGSRFSEPRQGGRPLDKVLDSPPRLNLQARLAKMDRLPAMPEMPARILALRNNRNSTVDDLVTIVEQDLSLTAQIMRYANSALFRHGEPVISIKDAIFRVLGYETVLNLSLGYALGRVFKLPPGGPLGHHQFWEHATYSAALAQRLSSLMPKDLRPKGGTAYLTGLLHDIGYLVLNVFFRNAYAWLNKMLLANPQTPPIEIERRLMGLTHMELGAWLMRAWQMPSELIVTVGEHHNPDYQGRHVNYVALINLTERLLKMHNLSDAGSDEIPPQLLASLGLEEEAVLLAMDEVLEGGETLREMAMVLSA